MSLSDLAIIGTLAFMYLCGGFLFLMASDLELRLHYPKVWATHRWFFAALLVWPVFSVWLQLKCLRHRHDV